MERVVNIGLIGCGGIAKSKHIPNLLKKPNAKIMALCDPGGRDYLEKVAADFGLTDAKIYEDYNELLRDGEIEAVHICTPNASHAPLTIAALQAGKHVMCEKPMAANAAEAAAMVEAWKQTDRKLTICSNNRFTKHNWHLKSLCEKGDLGEIYFAKAQSVRRRGVPTWGAFLDISAQGGGPVIDLGTHSLDLALWMMDNYKPKMVVGKTYDYIGKAGSPANPYGNWDPEKFTVEDSGFAMIIMENGATIYLESSWALNTRDEVPISVSLCGTKGGADVKQGNLTINTEEGGLLVNKQIEMRPTAIPFYEYAECYGPQLEISLWIDAIANDKQPVVSPTQMLTVARLIEAVYRSDREGRPVYFERGVGL